VRVGVLALQGAFARHAEILADLGASVAEVRTPAQLDLVDALVVPGGESTVISRLLTTSGLHEPLGERLATGMPAFGTCAGMILLASSILDGRPDQRCFGAIDIAVRRNGYGRQVDSFEADIVVDGLDEPFRAVFIRAPIVTQFGPDVTVLARHEDVPVLLRQGPVTVASFHPEFTADHRVHAQFLQEVG